MLNTSNHSKLAEEIYKNIKTEKIKICFFLAL